MSLERGCHVSGLNKKLFYLALAPTLFEFGFVMDLETPIKMDFVFKPREKCVSSFCLDLFVSLFPASVFPAIFFSFFLVLSLLSPLAGLITAKSQSQNQSHANVAINHGTKGLGLRLESVSMWVTQCGNFAAGTTTALASFFFCRRWNVLFQAPFIPLSPIVMLAQNSAV